MAGLEPYHSVVYFAPELKALTDELGCNGGWMCYFGLRAAPLGAASAAVVAASFYNFHPDRVGRAVPEVWRRGTGGLPGRPAARRRPGVAEVARRRRRGVRGGRRSR